MNNYLMVREFTNAVKLARGLEPCPCPVNGKPIAMNAEEVKFLVKMVMSEMAELVDTISESSEHTNAIMLECLGTDPSKHVKYNDAASLIAAQGDAMVDAWYYMCDAACKKGINVSEMFNLVHTANMNKLVDGKAIVREDGKVLKPPGWTEADIVGYVRKCLEEKDNSLNLAQLLIEHIDNLPFNDNTCMYNARIIYD
jgi:predicted HAD superfamily Cof-like phosphohydrolase